jgi:phosphopantothenate synthetase
MEPSTLPEWSSLLTGAATGGRITAGLAVGPSPGAGLVATGDGTGGETLGEPSVTPAARERRNFAAALLLALSSISLGELAKNWPNNNLDS